MGSLRGNAIIGQSGGPTVVINQSLVGVIEAAADRPEIEHLLGARFGVRGILKEDFADLFRESSATLEAVARTPSAALGSTRDKPSAEECSRMFEVMERYNVRYFFYIGGNDSAETASIVNAAAAQAGYELRCLHIPKTVDNDLLVTDHCPGYGSAARYVASAFIGDDLDSRALPGVKIDVCMGRHAGFLTAASALGRTRDDDGPHLIYLPEVPVTREQFRDEVLEVYERLGRCVVAVSEGIHDADRPGKDGPMTFTEVALEELKAQGPETSQHGNIQLSGSGMLGDWLAECVRAALKDQLQIKSPRVRADTFGYCQRSYPGAVSEVDALEARTCGRKAVEIATEADLDGSVVLVRTGNGASYGVEYARADLSRLARNTKVMPDEFILPDERFVTPAFLEYARPLVGQLPSVAHLEGVPFNNASG
jgi:6-phosphofructokinase 1